MILPWCTNILETQYLVKSCITEVATVFTMTECIEFFHLKIQQVLCEVFFGYLSKTVTLCWLIQRNNDGFIVKQHVATLVLRYITRQSEKRQKAAHNQGSLKCFKPRISILEILDAGRPWLIPYVSSYLNISNNKRFRFSVHVASIWQKVSLHSRQE